MVSASGLGGNPNDAAAFLVIFYGPTVDINVGADQKVFMTASKAMGAGANPAGELDLYPCYRLASDVNGTPIAESFGTYGLSVPANTKITFSVNWIFSGLTPNTYTFGMCGNTSEPGNWNNNEYGFVTAFVSN